MPAMLKIERDRCKGCELCTTVCPKSILALGKEKNKKGYSPIVVTEQGRCIACASCARICPDSAISVWKE